MSNRACIYLSLPLLLLIIPNIRIAQNSPFGELVPTPRALNGDDTAPLRERSDVFLIDDGRSTPRPKNADEEKVADSESADTRESDLQKLLNGAKLKGQFTMDGKPLSELQDETYEIRKIQKLRPDGDTWAIHARIKYGEHDVVVPVPIRIKWAGTTPVLTMDKMAIPGLGTFSARVVLHENRYAGTWQHDEVGGHLFGIIQAADTQGELPTDSAGDAAAGTEE